jgi:protein SCO1
MKHSPRKRAGPREDRFGLVVCFRILRIALLGSLIAVADIAAVAAHEAAADQRLPVIGPAPDFALTSQDGAPVGTASLRGKVVAVAFIYTRCPDICPLLTQKMAQVQDALGADFGARIAFVSITLDPEHDTPAVLKRYAQAWGANLKGWSFLTGPQTAIDALTRRYGAFAAKNGTGSIDHTQLTSIIDRDGVIRVQYLGARFNEQAFRRDLLSLTVRP